MKENSSSQVLDPSSNSLTFGDNLLHTSDVGETVFGGSLGGLGVRGILAEGDRLERERQDLSAGTRAFAFERYRAFICKEAACNNNKIRCSIHLFYCYY